MTYSARSLTLGTAAFLATAMAGAAFAQVPNAQPGAQAQANANANANAGNQGDDQHQTQQLITHALNMAINGSDLQQLANHAQGRNRQGQGQGQGQEEARDRNRNENNANANANANAEKNNANNENRRDGNARDQRDGNQDRQAAHQQAVHQLRVLAHREFESSSQLLRDAEAALNAGGNNAAGNARDDSRNAWSRRLQTAANQYATTLRSLSGVGPRAPEASGSNDDQDQNDRNRDRERADAGRNQGQREGNNQNQNQNANRGGMNRTEGVQVALLNQAVRQAVEAFELSQSHHHAFAGNNPGAGNNASGQRLQAHARQMSAESQQLIQQVQAGLSRQGARDQNDRDNQNRDRQADRERNPQNAGAGDQAQNAGAGAGDQAENNARQGQASVRQLAQQAQQLVETLQRINPAAGAATAAPAPASVR